MLIDMEVVIYETPFGEITIKQRHNSIVEISPRYKKYVYTYETPDKTGFYKVVEIKEIP